MHLLFPCWGILLFLLTFPLCLWLGNFAKIIRQAPLSPMLPPLERTSSRHPQSLYSFKGSAPRMHLPRVPTCVPGSWACLTRVQLAGSTHSHNLVMLFRLVLISTSTFSFFYLKKKVFWPCFEACGILFPQPRTELRPYAVRAWSPIHCYPLNHQWTAYYMNSWKTFYSAKMYSTPNLHNCETRTLAKLIISLIKYVHWKSFNF